MHEVLARNGRFLGAGTMTGELFVVDWYPGLVPCADPDARVHGEIWQLDGQAVWAKLDAYEECGPGDPRPHEFDRVCGHALLGGSRIATQVYAYSRPTEALPQVHDGDWKRWVVRQPPSSEPT